MAAIAYVFKFTSVLYIFYKTIFYKTARSLNKVNSIAGDSGMDYLGQMTKPTMGYC